jgi:ABC-type transporter Mla MlaB component
MVLYQHDSPATYRFVPRGPLTGEGVLQMQYAWDTTKSILGSKVVIVELSGVTDVDSSGLDLLSRMRESGARLTAAAPPDCEELHQFFTVPAAGPRPCRVNTWMLRILKRRGLAG